MKKLVLSLILTASIIFSGIPVFAGTSFDYEPNNSPDEAFEINSNSNIVSTISYTNDTDYYKFTVYGTVDASISLVSPQGLDYDIKLYDADFKEIASSEQSAGKTDVISKKSLAAGTYSIRVYCFDQKFTSAPYTLSVNTVDVKGQKPGHAGTYEGYVENTTLENAIEVNGNTTFRAKVSSLDESRYYKIVLDSISDADISMTSPEDADLDMKLYTSTGLEAGSSTNKSGVERITAGNLLPGTYYLKIYGSNSDFSSNTFEVQLKVTKAGFDQTVTDAVYGNTGGTDVNGQKPNDSVPKALLLYIGPGLTEFSDNDVKKMLVDDPINTKNFVIIDNGAQYNTYINSQGKLTEIVTPEKINALTVDKVDSTGELNLIKKDYLGFYKDIDKKNTLESFSDQAAKLALRMIKTDPEVKLYISIPGVNFHAMADEYIEPVKEKLIKGIKTRLDKVNPNYWDKNIEGFYFATEGIPYCYCWFKPDKTIDYNNPIIKTMSSLSNEIHQVYNKKFIWIPYYGSSIGDNNYYNKNQFVRIGYIANRTNIFDSVIIQPSYYFNPDSKNIPYVKDSVEKNIVLDTDQNIIGGMKDSRTKIGAEMEIDGNYAGKDSDAKGYQERFQEYLKAFKGVTTKFPVAFYAGTRDDLFKEAVYNAVKNLFKDLGN